MSELELFSPLGAGPQGDECAPPLVRDGAVPERITLSKTFYIYVNDEINSFTNEITKLIHLRVNVNTSKFQILQSDKCSSNFSRKNNDFAGNLKLKFCKKSAKQFDDFLLKY